MKFNLAVNFEQELITVYRSIGDMCRYIYVVRPLVNIILFHFILYCDPRFAKQWIICYYKSIIPSKHNLSNFSFREVEYFAIPLNLLPEFTSWIRILGRATCVELPPHIFWPMVFLMKHSKGGGGFLYACAKTIHLVSSVEGFCSHYPHSPTHPKVLVWPCFWASSSQLIRRTCNQSIFCSHF